MTERFYSEIHVWQSVDDQTLIRYRCIHILPDNKYAVKAADYIRDPLEKDNLKAQEQYFLESLFYGGLEMLIENACDSLPEAIAKFNKEFQVN